MSFQSVATAAWRNYCVVQAAKRDQKRDLAWGAYALGHDPKPEKENMSVQRHDKTYTEAVIGVLKGECWSQLNWKQGTYIYAHEGKIRVHRASGGNDKFTAAPSNYSHQNWDKCGTVANNEIEKLKDELCDTQYKLAAATEQNNIYVRTIGGTNCDLAFAKQSCDDQRATIRSLHEELERVKGEKKACFADSQRTLELEDQVRSLQARIENQAKTIRTVRETVTC